jgi:hypothetical protein
MILGTLVQLDTISFDTPMELKPTTANGMMVTGGMEINRKLP